MFFPEAAERLQSRLLQPETSAEIKGASIDTRTLRPGNLFVAIRGVKDNGHRFLDSAFEKGAGGALVDRAFADENKETIPASWKNLIPVPDTAEAFLKLSGHYKDSFSLKASVGVVGSVGKTSTKEFLAYLLRRKFKTLSTQGNLNNHLGLPLTLLGLDKSHEVCVCELGTDRLGEVRQLAQVLRPDHGLLTRIAPEHLESFGSMENVYAGEMELFECLRPGSSAVIPDDDQELLKRTTKFPLKWIKVGVTENADIRVSDIHATDGMVHFKFKEKTFSFPGMAPFLARNAAMALAMAEVCGVSHQEIPEVWNDFTLPGGRFQPQELPGGARVIFDGYNASPASFEAALESFGSLKADGKKILVFSDMLELGPNEKKYHEDLGTQIAVQPFDYVAAYGKRSAWSLDALKRKNPRMAADHVSDAREAAERLRGRLKKNDWVLLKGSRSMKVEEVIHHLFGNAGSAAH